ncbi:MAG: tryptophan 7-halogenase [Planctomycetes bacterium]|nr:tryptophan 7-halogenase [Planctomycetota bacterium]
MKDHYDCAVLGGGPAGCAAAAIIAESGFSTLLIERERVPRFHVGESLMPESYWTLKRLGVLEKMKASDFVRKLSVQFVSHTGKESQPFFFREHDPRECSQTWQVERADFDKLLFDNAAEKGADCRDKTRALAVHFDGDRARGLTLQTDDGRQHEVSSKVVIDATGQQALIANSLGIRVDDPCLRKAAIWGYYRHARRDDGENGGATIILHTSEKQSWFWFIPLSNSVTSIGVVGDRDYLLKGRGRPADVFEDELVKCPALVERLADAELVSELRAIKEFSYSTQRQAGEGWVLIGDAFGFIDPIYSSGVYFALKSGELAADAVVEGLRRGDTSAAQLGAWVQPFQEGTRWIRQLVDVYYTQEFSLGRFLRDHPEHRGNLTDLLIGRIFHGEAGMIFDDLMPALDEARAARRDDANVAAQEA